MIKLIEFLFHGCFHKWEILKTVNVYSPHYKDMPMGNDFILKCEKCGNIKIKRQR